jgi:serine/threonine protein kinase
MAPQVGTYKLLERLGAGGLGEVYRARDTKTGRTVAIKAVSRGVTDTPARRQALIADATAVARLSHPNVAVLFEVGETEDQTVFLAYEYVLGETLRAVIGDRPLNVRRAVDLAVQLADALAEAHRLGILHGDLRPENVMVTQSGRPKVLDSGLLRWTQGGAERRAAVQGTAPPASYSRVLGYLSPEQALGEPIDHRSDVFTLGSLLFEMLTGRSPFAAASAGTTLVQVVQLTPPPPSSLAPRVPPALDGIVARALRKSLDARTQSTQTMAAALREVLSTLDTEPRRTARASLPPPRPADAAARGAAKRPWWALW